MMLRKYRRGKGPGCRQKFSPAVTSFLNRGRLPPRLHYLATFHPPRHTASFTTRKSQNHCYLQNYDPQYSAYLE
ncbi:hypothetical protein ALC62_11261 [Cyphomyrmex costatus]|uniref:Uncharacterized protein n=1 Tax=Cyphomyrmex costatus TaxID=456900 RepID=A0A195CB34_9HYME|nr:hypothetical protein ALC62_11261 [Cyphomyrmex costatus]